MKRFVKLALICAMAVLSATAFANGNKESAPAQSAINTKADLNGKALATPAFYPSTPEMAEKDLGFKPGSVEAYPTINEMLAGLLSGRVDVLPLHNAAAHYVVQSNPALKLIEPALNDVKISYVMLTRAADAALLAKLNGAIKTLSDNGTLAAFDKRYINNDNIVALLKESAPSMTNTPGGQTVTVALGGDALPMDYVSADGKPSGYNVALLAEVGKLAELNITLQAIPAESQFQALSSGRVDIIFLSMSGLQLPEGVAETDAYFSENGIYAIVRK
jgi:ABC-type amino acid transport substrate-binding protein